MATRSPALPAFVVDKGGLAKILARKGKGFAVIELVQNAWDENTTQVDVILEPEPGRRGVWRLTVEDDNPEGFKDLTHAYTLFAESSKKGDATKRGRFNLGEKLVIAICESAEISTTKGTIVFEGDTRRHSRKSRNAGSRFTGVLKLTADEVAEIQRLVQTLLPPHDIVTTFNLAEVPHRAPIRSFTVALRTELDDGTGAIRPTTRNTKVSVYEPAAGEQASIYELGIPVVATGDRWHVDVQQKVPLGTDRDSVPPGYLRDVRVAVLNHCYDLLTAADAKANWATNAMEDEKADPDAVKAVFTGRFGDKAVILDPNDSEANKRAASEGYTVVPGGALPRAVWAHVREHAIARPAGQVTPTPRAGGDGTSPAIRTIDPAHWTADQQRVAEFVQTLGRKLLGYGVNVAIANDVTWPFGAAFNRESRTVTYNLGRLGHRWFEQPLSRPVLDLTIHEFAHEFESDHLSANFFRACTRLGAACTMLALDEPDVFERFRAHVEVAV